MCGDNNCIYNIIAIFIQTTSSCRSDMIISKYIKLNQQNILLSNLIIKYDLF
jgi:hypothetical protein